MPMNVREKKGKKVFIEMKKEFVLKRTENIKRLTCTETAVDKHNERRSYPLLFPIISCNPFKHRWKYCIFSLY